MYIIFNTGTIALPFFNINNKLEFIFSIYKENITVFFRLISFVHFTNSFLSVYPPETTQSRAEGVGPFLKIPVFPEFAVFSG